MVSFILFCIYLFRNIHSSTGETTTFISVMKSSGTDRTLINSSPITKDIAVAETATFVTNIKISGTDTTFIKNFSPTTIYTLTEETVSLINDIETSDTDTSDSTTLTDDYVYTTTDSTTPKCEETISVNISQKYEELIISKDQLDELFEQTMTACHSFARTKSHSTGEFTISLANEYLTKSKNFIDKVQLQETIIRCQNNTSSKTYVIDGIDEYEEKLEIVEILSNELGKMMGNEREYAKLQNNDNEQNGTEEMMSLIEELHDIVRLNKRVKDLEMLGRKQYNIYESSQKIRDLDDLITTLTEMIKIQNKILNIVRSSESMKYLYDDEYGSKFNMVKNLVNASNVEEKLNTYEKYLIGEFEEHDIEEALLQLNQIIRPFVLGVIFLVGITGNGVLLRVFINHKDMRTAPNVMLINLNICDILGLIFNILLYVIETLMTDWTLGTILCKLYRFCRYLTLGLSIYSIMVISIQRFLALTNYFSLEFKCRFFGKFQSILNVFLVWVLASAVASPRAIKAQVSSQVCWAGTVEDREFFNKILYVDFALYCALPFLIIAVTSGLSSNRLRSSVKNMPGEAVGQEKVIQARVLSSNIFVALTVVFAICYMPYFVYMTYLKNIGSNASFMTQKYIAFALYCLIHSNASFNPIALYLVSAKYKNYMRKYLSFTYREKKPIDETSAQSNITIDTRM